MKYAKTQKAGDCLDLEMGQRLIKLINFLKFETKRFLWPVFYYALQQQLWGKNSAIPQESQCNL